MANITSPNAKINLGLYVVGRRSDGYHNIETIFYPIPLTDRLEISEDDELELIVSGIPVAGNTNDNLVMKVYDQLRRDFDIPPVYTTLEKNIPSGAGLGGGSSDAAFMMKMLNKEFDLGMSDEQMERRVSLLGADCAFFIKNRPTMAEGIGNEFSPVQVDLSGWYLVLVKPDDFVSTKEAYAGITPKAPRHDLREAIKQPVKEWKNLIFNDFEDSIFPNHPTIANIKQTLYQLGATYASMSGSGSTVFALFDHKPIGIKDIFEPHFIYEAQL